MSIYTIRTPDPNPPINQYNNQTKLVMSSNGYLHAVWQEFDDTYTKYSIMYGVSTNGGVSWTVGTARVTNYDCGFPSICTDNSTLYVAYVENDGGTAFPSGQIKVIKKAPNSSTVWDAPVVVTSATGYPQYAPSICIGSGSAVHVVWTGIASGSYVVARHSYGYYGSSFSVPYTVSSATSNKGYASCCYSAVEDKVFMFWNDLSTSNRKIDSRRYDGAYWAIANIYTDTLYTPGIPACCCDNLGNIHIVWQSSNGRIHYREWQYTPSNGLLTAVALINETSASHMYPTIQVDTGTPFKLHAFWQGKSSGQTYYSIRYDTSLDGATWTPTTLITPTTADLTYPNTNSGNIDTGFAFTYLDSTTLKFYKTSQTGFPMAHFKVSNTAL